VVETNFAKKQGASVNNKENELKLHFLFAEHFLTE